MPDIAVGHITTPFVSAYPWTPGTGFGTKYANPGTLPPDRCYGADFCGSTDLALAHLTTPRVSAYPWTVGSGFGTKYSNPATLPIGDGDSVDFCGSTDLAVGHYGSPYLSVYPWTPGAGFGTKYSNPATLPGDPGEGVNFCGATDVSVASGASPYINAYPWTPGTGFGTKYANPGTLPTGYGYDSAFCGSTDLAASHGSSVYVTAYPWTPGTGFGTKYANPGTLPTGNGRGVSFCGSTDVAVAHINSPRITAYPWTPGTGFGTKYANPGTLPAGHALGTRYYENTDIAVAHNTTPFVSAYPWTPGTGFGTKYANPGTLPPESGLDLAFSGTGIGALTVATQAVSDISYASATGNGNIMDDGGTDCDKRGFVFGTSSLGDPGDVAPAASGYDDYVEEAGAFNEGTFDNTLDGLSDGTTYFARAYAHNSLGYSYGDEVQFDSLEYTAPTLVTGDITPGFLGFHAIAEITATGGGTVTKRGIAYNITGNDPDPLTDSKVEELGSFGTGNFSESATGLIPGVTYYVRPYAYTVGGSYGYGAKASITLEPFGRIQALYYTRTAGESADISFTLMRAGGDGVHVLAVDETTPDYLAIIGTSQTASPSLYRVFLFFDLTGISTNFASLRFKFYCYSKGADLAGNFLYLVEGEQGTTIIIPDDWVEANNKTTILATIDCTDLEVGEWATMNFTPEGIAFVKSRCGGMLKLIMMHNHDFENNYPVQVHNAMAIFYLPHMADYEPYLEFYDYSPSLKLELAFGQAIFTANPIWTDVTEDMLDLYVKRGRMHELGHCEAGTAIFTLNNDSGDWWRLNAEGAHFPDVKPLTLVRLSAVIPLYYGIAESFESGWLEKAGGFGAISTLNCVDVFKSFSRYRILDANPTLTADASSGQTQVIIDSARDLVAGQSIEIYDSDAAETNEIESIDAGALTVTMANNLANTYTTGREARLKKFPAVPSGTRIKDIVLEVRWPIALTSIDAGQVKVIKISPPLGGTNALEALRKTTEAEDGNLFISAAGMLTFHDSVARTVSPYNESQATFDDGVGSKKYVSLELSDDDEFIYNEADISGDGIGEQIMLDEDSQDNQGPRALVKSDSLIYNGYDAIAQAFSFVMRYKESILRCKAMHVKPNADPMTLFPLVYAFDIGTRIKLQLNSDKNPASIDKEYHIEGIIHKWSASEDDWLTTWQLWDVNQYRWAKAAHDGYLTNINDITNYQDCHDAAEASAGPNNDSEDGIEVGQWTVWGGGVFLSARIQRALVEFDTSEVPANADITEAHILLYVSAAWWQNAWSLVAVDPDTVDCPVEKADYGVILGSTVPASELTQVTGPYWLVISLNAYGLSLINKGGTTRFAFRSNRDIGATDPGDTSKEYARIAGVGSFEGAFMPRLIMRIG